MFPDSKIAKDYAMSKDKAAYQIYCTTLQERSHQGSRRISISQYTFRQTNPYNALEQHQATEQVDSPILLCFKWSVWSLADIICLLAYFKAKGVVYLILLESSDLHWLGKSEEDLN